ncbi:MULTISPECIES: methyltransferase domain-containing protein [unclassified Methanoculleus]|jgi:hypothetical protein|uniref:methyltransferase domain-containing protein n=1 Tax=unclassified Methanoculleus TaxID=2619537 RepID=UPI0025FA15D6|nr:methyltransferase domain-containing protein [Methanoculleus sp. UBA377]MDD2473489.1 methyltransferase domain-containing protein [Methanoculleus sp.]
MSEKFDPEKFYESYPLKVIARPGYTTRAQYKSTLLWDRYGDIVLKILGRCRNYADIGGCFGFGANAMRYQIFCTQGSYPATKVFEISPEFISIGKHLFPYIEFIKTDFRLYNGAPDVFDLITLFDIIEHVQNPEEFLISVAKRTKLALIKTPMETGGDWFGAKPPLNQGESHGDGHINFYSPKEYLALLDRSGLELLAGKFVKSIVPSGTGRRILIPECSLSKKSLLTAGLSDIYQMTPYFITRRLVGRGDHIGLVGSRRNL